MNINFWQSIIFLSFSIFIGWLCAIYPEIWCLNVLPIITFWFYLQLFTWYPNIFIFFKKQRQLKPPSILTKAKLDTQYYNKRWKVNFDFRHAVHIVWCWIQLLVWLCAKLKKLAANVSYVGLESFLFSYKALNYWLIAIS